MILLYSIASILVISILLNIYLLYKLKTKATKQPMTNDARELLRHLFSSNAMMHIRVLDPGDFFLKSPRD